MSQSWMRCTSDTIAAQRIKQAQLAVAGGGKGK